MRIGRAENKSIILNKGMFFITSGLMHMRIAIEDTLIVEWSNKDDDSIQTSLKMVKYTNL